MRIGGCALITMGWLFVIVADGVPGVEDAGGAVEGTGGVHDVGGYGDALAGVEDADFVVKGEFDRAFQNEGDLFVGMVVQGQGDAGFEIDEGQHHFVEIDGAAVEAWGHIGCLEVVDGVEGHGWFLWFWGKTMDDRRWTIIVHRPSSLALTLVVPRSRAYSGRSRLHSHSRQN